MRGDANIAQVASLLADPTRASFLALLSDGRALPAGELARSCRVSPSSASAHLAKLVESGFLIVECCGRHRYFRIANHEICQLLESLAIFAKPTPIGSLRESELAKSLRFARTCYDHLAGSLGVAITQALLDQEMLLESGDHYDVTKKGIQHFQMFGINITGLRQQRRAFATRCLDWTERRHHLAGALGAALISRYFDLGWLKRAQSHRAVYIGTIDLLHTDEILGQTVFVQILADHTKLSGGIHQ